MRNGHAAMTVRVTEKRKPTARIELTTFRLRSDCSTTKLRWLRLTVDPLQMLKATSVRAQIVPPQSNYFLLSTVSFSPESYCLALAEYYFDVKIYKTIFINSLNLPN